MSATKPIPFEGVLNCWNDEHDLPDLLLAVCRSQKTGRLRFSNPEADKTLYVKDGRVIFAESTSDDDALGLYLLRTGKLSLEHYDRVSKLVEPGKRLGALLVAEGVLEPKELVPAVVGQVRAIIIGLFRRTESWYGFKEEELPRKEAITLDMPVAELVLEGVQSVDSWRRVSKGVGDFHRVHRLVESEEADWSRLKLEPSVSELLSVLKEPATISQACAQSRLPDFEACRLLWAFRSLGWIEAAGISASIADVPEEPVASAVSAEAVEPEAAAPVSVQSDAQEIDGDGDEASLAIAAAAASDLATTVESAPVAKTAIPERLIQTRVSMTPPQPPQKPAATKPSAPPPIPDDLVKTQIIVNPPEQAKATASPTMPAETTLPEVAVPSKPIADELVHTQLLVDAPVKSEGAGATLSTPSAAEMMESILNEGGPRGSTSPPEAPAPVSGTATQFFSGSSALDLPPAEEEETGAGPGDDAFSLPEESYDDYLRDEVDVAAGFDALSMEQAPPADPSPEPTVTQPELPDALPEEAQLTMASFQDFTLSDPHVKAPPSLGAAAPVTEASLASMAAEGGEEEGALPVLEGEIVSAEPEPPAPAPSGMEFLIGDDPFAAPPAAPSPSFATEDILTKREEPVAASIPKRPRTDEMDFDMEGFGHVLGRDE